MISPSVPSVNPTNQKERHRYCLSERMTARVARQLAALRSRLKEEGHLDQVIRPFITLWI